jgi:hypothetical protein
MSANESTPGEAKGEIIETAVDPDGRQLLLRRAAGGFEIVSDGRVVMQSALRRSERELVNLGMVPLRDRNDITVLVAGLGMGYLLAAVLESPRVIRVDVVEHCPAIIEWNRNHLSTLHREPPLADARVHVHQMGLLAYLRAMRYGTLPDVKLEGGGYLALLADLDDGPSALSRPRNEDLYDDDGLSDLEFGLRPGGVLALWSAQREQALLGRLNGRFQNLAEIAVPVDVPGHAGLDYIYRGRKRAPAGGARSATRAQA